MVLVGLCFGYFNLHLNGPVIQGRSGDSVNRDFQRRLPAVELRKVAGRSQLFAGEDVREQARIVKLVEEGFYWSDVEGFSREPPEDLVPAGGRAVKFSVGGHNQPLAVVRANQSGQELAGVRVEKIGIAVLAQQRQQGAIGIETQSCRSAEVGNLHERFAVGGVHQLDAFVAKSRGQGAGVTTDGQSFHGSAFVVLGTRELRDLLAAGGIENINLVVVLAAFVSSNGDARAVQAKSCGGDLSDFLVVS